MKNQIESITVKELMSLLKQADPKDIVVVSDGSSRRFVNTIQWGLYNPSDKQPKVTLRINKKVVENQNEIQPNTILKCPECGLEGEYRKITKSNNYLLDNGVGYCKNCNTELRKENKSR